MDNIRMNHDELLKAQMLRRMHTGHHELSRREMVEANLLIGGGIVIIILAIAAIWVC